MAPQQEPLRKPARADRTVRFQGASSRAAVFGSRFESVGEDGRIEVRLLRASYRFRAFACVAFVLADLALRVAFSRRFDIRFTRPEFLFVDLRDGLLIAESSSFAPPIARARFDTLRFAVLPPPAFRSAALTPRGEVSTGSSRRGRGGRFGFGGFASRCC